MKLSFPALGGFLLVPFLCLAWQQNSSQPESNNNLKKLSPRRRRLPLKARIRLSQHRRIWRKPRNSLATIAPCATALPATAKAISQHPRGSK